MMKEMMRIAKLCVKLELVCSEVYKLLTVMAKFRDFEWKLKIEVDLQHMDQSSGSNLVQIGIDLKEFYLSVEWDILEVPARRNEEYYPCCQEPYP
ncbi:unnamed protein product, partial [Allacma fusca]